jgi:TRAP-type C4-dicarboxylate transport system permease small subunit
MKVSGKAFPVARSIASLVDRTSIFFARGVVAALVAMVLLTCADVFLRYIFRRSIMGSTEVVGHYFMVAVVFLPLAYGMITRGGHIKVEFAVSRLPLRLQLVLETLGLLLSLGIYSLITWYGAVGVFRSWKTGETMVNVALPLWPGRILVVIGGLLLCAQIIVSMCRNAERLFEDDLHTSEARPIQPDAKELLSPLSRQFNR